MPFCPNCGNRLVDGAKFCSGCGNSVAAITAAAAAPTPAPAPAPAQPVYVQPTPAQPVSATPVEAKKSKTNWTVAIILILVGLLIVGGGITVIADLVSDGEFNLFGLLDFDSSSNEDEDEDEDDDKKKDDEDEDKNKDDEDENTGDDEDNTPATDAPDNNVEATTPPAPTEPDPTIGNDVVQEGQTVYDSNGLTISYINSDIVDSYLTFYFEVTNNTGHDIDMYSDYIAFDGMIVTSYFSIGNCPNGASAEALLEVDSILLEGLGMEYIHQIDIAFTAYDDSTYETVVSDAIDTVMTGESGSNRLNTSGVLVVDQAGVSVVCTGYLVDVWGYTNLFLYMENNTGSDIYVSLNSISLNGAEAYGYINVYIPAGGSAFDYCYFSESELESMGITSLENATFSFSAEYAEPTADYEWILFEATEPVTVTFN